MKNNKFLEKAKLENFLGDEREKERLYEIT